MRVCARGRGAAACSQLRPRRGARCRRARAPALTRDRPSQKRLPPFLPPSLRHSRRRFWRTMRRDLHSRRHLPMPPMRSSQCLRIHLRSPYAPAPPRSCGCSSVLCSGLCVWCSGCSAPCSGFRVDRARCAAQELKFDRLIDSLAGLAPRFEFTLPPYFLNNARCASGRVPGLRGWGSSAAA
jgi:hypothetical protein